MGHKSWTTVTFPSRWVSVRAIVQWTVCIGFVRKFLKILHYTALHRSSKSTTKGALVNRVWTNNVVFHFQFFNFHFLILKQIIFNRMIFAILSEMLQSYLCHFLHFKICNDKGVRRQKPQKTITLYISFIIWRMHKLSPQCLAFATTILCKNFHFNWHSRFCGIVLTPKTF